MGRGPPPGGIGIWYSYDTNFDVGLSLMGYTKNRGVQRKSSENTARLVSVPPNTAGNRTPSDGWSLYLQARKGLITYQCMIHGKRSVPGIELRDLLLDVQVLYQLSYIDLYFPIVHAPSRPISTYTRSSCRSTSTVHVCHSRIPSCWVGGPPQGGSVSGTAMTRTSMWAFL